MIKSNIKRIVNSYRPQAVGVSDAEVANCQRIDERASGLEDMQIRQWLLCISSSRIESQPTNL